MLLLEKKNQTDAPQEFSKFDSIDLSEQGNFYFSVFEILKQHFSKTDLGKIFANFQVQYEGMRGTFESSTPKIFGEQLNKQENKAPHKITLILTKREGRFASAFLIMSLVGICLLTFKAKIVPAQQRSQASINQEINKENVIRSDLIVPTESSLLHRPELIAQIDSKFKTHEGIQTVALVGPGGAGKTTLSRQYAHLQKANIIWEINAETKESLGSSFENLAQALAKTEGDKKL